MPSRWVEYSAGLRARSTIRCGTSAGTPTTGTRHVRELVTNAVVVNELRVMATPQHRCVDDSR